MDGINVSTLGSSEQTLTESPKILKKTFKDNLKRLSLISLKSGIFHNGYLTFVPVWAQIISGFLMIVLGVYFLSSI